MPMGKHRDLVDPTDPASLRPERRLTEIATILAARGVQITGRPSDGRGHSDMATVRLQGTLGPAVIKGLRAVVSKYHQSLLLHAHP